MATKKEVKNSEARIMLKLHMIPALDSFTRKLSLTLDIDYNYIITILKGMKHKGWVVSYESHNKTFYHLTPEAPISKAKTILAGGGLGV